MSIKDLGPKAPKNDELELEDIELEDKDEKEIETDEEDETERPDGDDDGESEDEEPEGEESEDEESEDEEPEGEIELQELIEAHDKNLKNQRRELRKEWRSLDKRKSSIEDFIHIFESNEKNPKNPKGILFDGEPSYLIPDKVFEDRADEIEILGDSDLKKALIDARKERRAYKEYKALIIDFKKNFDALNKIYLKDVKLIEKTLLKSSPAYKSHWDSIGKAINDKLQNDPDFNEEFTWANARERMDIIAEIIEDLGINKKIKKTKEVKKGVKQSVTTKARRGTPNARKAPIFTREQIAKMSMAEYERREKEIDKAYLENRVR